MWEIAGWVALGAVLMLLLVVVVGRWERRRQARAEWEANEQLRRAVEEDDRHCLKGDVRVLERQLDLVKGNVEYLQTQNAGQGREWALLMARADEHNLRLAALEGGGT